MSVVVFSASTLYFAIFCIGIADDPVIFISEVGRFPSMILSQLGALLSSEISHEYGSNRNSMR